MFYTRDNMFFPRLIAIVIPILVQNLLNSSLNFIDVFMIGQLGETAVAAVGSSNQFFFVFIMLMFGFASGSAIFTAQYWGARDIKRIRSFMGISLSVNFVVSLLTTVLVLIFSRQIIQLFSGDPQVISLGSSYLRIICLICPAVAVNISFAMTLRSTEDVIYPMAASLIGISINTLLNYILIFGNFGFPSLGVRGAAYATVTARSIEVLLVITMTYIKKLPAAAAIGDFFRYHMDDVKTYFRRTVPVILQSAGWSLGYTSYSMIYGHISTESLAAFNISGSIERICLIFFTGLGSACSIMVGNRIGAGEEEKARGYAGNFLALALITAFVISGILLFIRTPVVEIYNFSQISKFYARSILLVMACSMWAKASNIVFHMGIFKAGGDTLFSMIVDVGGVWIIGVPLAAVSGLIFHFPIHHIFALLVLEELIKMGVGYSRLFSGKWLHNLVSP